jgi:uncharacterized protein YbjT (DUF2867 family)
MLLFVSGITGQVGGAAARRLLAEGHTVRTLARTPQKAAEWSAKGVDVRAGDSNDAAAVAGALEGVDGAFVMVPPCVTPAPGYPESVSIIASLREALGNVTPPRVVVLSSIGSEKTSGLGLITATHLLEEALSDLPVPTAFVRAGSFFENYAGSLAGATATGVFYTFYAPAERPVPMIATEDIGNEVAHLLTTEWTGKRIIELGSPLTGHEVASAMSEVLGKPVTAQAIPREQWAATLESFGLPHGSTWAYEEMLDGVNSGWIDFGVPGTEKVAGTKPVAEVFRQANKA